jgi:hypothetical protein
MFTAASLILNSLFENGVFRHNRRYREIYVSKNEIRLVYPFSIMANSIMANSIMANVLPRCDKTEMEAISKINRDPIDVTDLHETPGEEKLMSLRHKDCNLTDKRASEALLYHLYFLRFDIMDKPIIFITEILIACRPRENCVYNLINIYRDERNWHIRCFAVDYCSHLSCCCNGEFDFFCSQRQEKITVLQHARQVNLILPVRLCA